MLAGVSSRYSCSAPGLASVVQTFPQPKPAFPVLCFGPHVFEIILRGPMGSDGHGIPAVVGAPDRSPQGPQNTSLIITAREFSAEFFV